MKKPSAYLPLYGNDFFEAIAGYAAAAGGGNPKPEIRNPKAVSEGRFYGDEY